jgi:hypothetical protein
MAIRFLVAIIASVIIADQSFASAKPQHDPAEHGARCVGNTISGSNSRQYNDCRTEKLVPVPPKYIIDVSCQRANPADTITSRSYYDLTAIGKEGDSGMGEVFIPADKPLPIANSQRIGLYCVIYNYGPLPVYHLKLPRHTKVGANSFSQVIDVPRVDTGPANGFRFSVNCTDNILIENSFYGSTTALDVDGTALRKVTMTKGSAGPFLDLPRVPEEILNQ